MSWAEDLTGEFVKSVSKSVENEWIRNRWKSIPCIVLGVQETTPVFEYGVSILI